MNAHDDACPVATVYDAMGERPKLTAQLSSGARVDVLALVDAAAGHARCLASFAQDTGAFRANNAQAADLANACAAALAVIEARAAVAELVEAGTAIRARVPPEWLEGMAAGRMPPGDGLFVKWQDVDRLRAALAAFSEAR